MSGTPKRCNAYMQAERRRQAEEERQQRAREEAERRAAEERRLALERCNRIRARGVSQAATLAHAINVLGNAPATRFLPAGAIDQTDRQLVEAVAAVHAATDEAAAQAANRRLADLGQQISRLQTQERAAGQVATQLAADLAEADRELARLSAVPAARYLPAESVSAWPTQIHNLMQAASSAVDVAVLHRGLTEVGRVRGELRRAGGEADAVHRAAAAVAAELPRAHDRLNAFAASELRSFAAPGQVESLQNRLLALDAQLASATDRDGVAVVARSTTQAQDEIRQVGETAASARLAEHLDQEYQALARLEGEIAGIDAARSAKFDKAGIDGLKGGVIALRARLERKELEPARQEMAALRNAFAAHCTEVARRFKQWQIDYENTQTAQASALAALDAVRHDSDRKRWAFPMASDLDRKLKESDRLSTVEDFPPAQRLATEVERDSVQLAGLTDQCKAESARLAELRLRAGAVQPVEGRLFDVEGARDLTRFLDAAESALRQTRPAEAEKHLATATDRLARHEKSATDEANRWQKEYDEAAAALGSTRDRLAALRTDEVVGRWEREGLEALERQIVQAHDELEKGRFSNVLRIVAKLAADAKKVVEAANGQQLQADLQAQIADGVERVMREMGFTVDPGFEAPGDPRSAVILNATRANGDLIVAAIEHEGRIEYDVGGRLEKRAEVNALNQRVQRCDEAEEQIRRMHEVLRKLGIDTTDLEWDDQPPPDDEGAAARNPVLAEFRQIQRQARTARR